MTELAVRTGTWAALVAATLCSAWAVSHVASQAALIAAIMTLAACKALLVFRHFMGAGTLPAPLRWLFVGWSTGCAGMIVAFAVLS